MLKVKATKFSDLRREAVMWNRLAGQGVRPSSSSGRTNASKRQDLRIRAEAARRRAAQSNLKVKSRLRDGA